MADGKDYITITQEFGTIHISEDVVAAIAVGAVREVDGVSGMMSNLSSTVTELVTSKKNAQKNLKGVKIDLNDDAMKLDLYIMVEYGHAIPEVAENAQKAVSSAVTAMTGCRVASVNIHVGGITLS